MSSQGEVDIQIRSERAEDRGYVRHVNELAFERTVEADLIDALRAALAVTLSMVAVANTVEGWEASPLGGEIVGHALVTPVTVTSDDPNEQEATLLGLGPVAVLPSHQRQGIGTLLIDTCLEDVRVTGHAGIVVVGHPGYFPRFGFIPASRWGLRRDGEMPNEVFMAMELTPGLLSGIHGTVRFRPEFGET